MIWLPIEESMSSNLKHSEGEPLRAGRWTVSIALTMALGLLAGACSDDVIDLDAEGAQGEGSGQTSSSTSSTDPPGPTEAPATTESTTSTTTTTTTTLPGSGVIVGAEGVAGWSEGGEWRTLEDGALPAAAGDTYNVIYLTDPITTVAGGAPSAGCEFVDPSADIDVGIEADTWPMPFPIAISANWDLVPHDVELLGTDSTTYKDIASDLLFGQGVDDPDPTLVQLIRTDLEGDGVDEILVAAERKRNGSAQSSCCWGLFDPVPSQAHRGRSSDGRSSGSRSWRSRRKRAGSSLSTRCGSPRWPI